MNRKGRGRTTTTLKKPRFPGWDVEDNEQKLITRIEEIALMPMLSRPSVKELSDEFKCAINTLKSKIDKLEEEDRIPAKALTSVPMAESLNSFKECREHRNQEEKEYCTSRNG